MQRNYVGIAKNRHKKHWKPSAIGKHKIGHTMLYGNICSLPQMTRVQKLSRIQIG